MSCTRTQEDWTINQLRNVRRVLSHQMHRFLHSPALPRTAQLVQILAAQMQNKLGGHVELYDLHFLRQFGGNAAAFSRHRDIQDTGVASTSQIAGGCSILLGGWRYVEGRGGFGGEVMAPSLAEEAEGEGGTDCTGQDGSVGGQRAWSEYFAPECSASDVMGATHSVVLTGWEGVEGGEAPEDWYQGCDCAGPCVAGVCVCVCVCVCVLRA